MSDLPLGPPSLPDNIIMSPLRALEREVKMQRRLLADLASRQHDGNLTLTFDQDKIANMEDPVLEMFVDLDYRTVTIQVIR